MGEQDLNKTERLIREEAKRQGITVEEFKRRAKEAIKILNRITVKIEKLMFKQGQLLKEIRDDELYKYLGHDSVRYRVETEPGVTVAIAEGLKKRAHEADERLSNINKETAGLTLKQGKTLKKIRDNESYLCFGYYTFRYCVENELGITEEEALEFIRLSEKYPPAIFDKISNIPPEIQNISFKIFIRHSENLLKKLEDINFRRKLEILLKKQGE